MLLVIQDYRKDYSLSYQFNTFDVSYLSAITVCGVSKLGMEGRVNVEAFTTAF